MILNPKTQMPHQHHWDSVPMWRRQTRHKRSVNIHSIRRWPVLYKSSRILGLHVREKKFYKLKNNNYLPVGFRRHPSVSQRQRHYTHARYRAYGQFHEDRRQNWKMLGNRLVLKITRKPVFNLYRSNKLYSRIYSSSQNKKKIIWKTKQNH